MVGLLERRRIDLVFGALPARQLGVARANERLERLERRSGKGVDPPRLQVAARRGARRAFEDVADHRERHRGRQKGAAAEAARNGVTHVHNEWLRQSASAAGPRRSRAAIGPNVQRIGAVDKTAALRLNATMRRLALAFLLAWSAPAAAMVGGAAPADPAVARHVVLIVGSRGTFCTGVAIARDLVLTAAHCTLPGADYKLMELDAHHQPTLRDIADIARHPQFDLKTLLAHRATADLTLIRLAAPLGGNFAPAALAVPDRPVTAGDPFVVAGYGVAVRGDGKSSGVVRIAHLIATGQPGSLQIRLVDGVAKGARAGLGACTGDSGAPVFWRDGARLAVAGVVSWSTGPNLSDGCGGLTGVTPLVRYREWIVETARALGSPLPP